MSNLFKNRCSLGVLLTELFKNKKICNESCYKFRTIDGRCVSINYVSNKDDIDNLSNKDKHDNLSNKDANELERYYHTELKTDHIVVKSRIHTNK